jgi:pyruvate dehydrogenase complex dehydrogenase (E1) component
MRKHFFGKYPSLLKLVEHLSDDQLAKMRWAATIRRRSTPPTTPR